LDGSHAPATIRAAIVAPTRKTKIICVKSLTLHKKQAFFIVFNPENTNQ